MFKDRFRKKVNAQKTAGLHRNPPQVEKRDGKHLIIGGKRMLSFAGNDYLGLSEDQRLKEIVSSNFAKYGTSSSSSRLVSGNYSVIGEAEAAFAEYFGYDEALFFPSGYQCNLGLLSTLFTKGDTVYYDKHIHASSVKGITLSGASPRGYKHNRVSHLAKRLGSDTQCQAPVVTESLFSMDGDLLDIEGLGQLKKEHNFLTVVDEAHAFGAMGEKGKGIAKDVADIAVGTFGKALALFGAFMLLPEGFKEYILNFSSPMIYTTTLPEAHAASAIDLLPIIEGCDDRREHLKNISATMRKRLTNEGFKVSGDAHIIAVELGEETKTVEVTQALFNRNIFVFPARFPTVPLGRAIIRVGMTALHDKKDVKLFIEKLKEACNEVC